VAGAVAHHGLSRTSAAMPGLVNYHSLKNVTAVYVKNMPTRLVPESWWRFGLLLAFLVYESWHLRLRRMTVRALGVTVARLPRTLRERRRIQGSARVDARHVRSLLTTEMPPHHPSLDRFIVKWHLGSVYPGRD
jgi:hypothetical protein